MHEDESDGSASLEEAMERKEEAAAPVVFASAAAQASTAAPSPPTTSAASSPVPSSSSSSPPVKLSPADFLPSVLLGEGSYSQVYLVESRTVPPQRYAMKVLSKAHLHRYARAHMAIVEKAALSRCCHPCIVRLHHTFQDAQSLYFILELCEGGDVFAAIDELGGLPLPVVRFYAAQLLCALHYLHHSAHILHRDVKPENLMLTLDRQLKLADFGTAKLLLDDEPAPQQRGPSSAPSPPSASPKKRSFVGTAAYVAPEILNDGEVGYGVDQWSAGCSVYQMMTGTTPFNAASEYLTFQRILHGELRMQPGMDADACDLIRRLMDREPGRRVGCRPEDWREVEGHPFFAGVDWRRIQEGTAQCPPLPSPLKGKKFSLVSEESLMGWTRKGADGEERKRRADDDGTDDEWSQRNDSGGGGDERRRGETMASEGPATTAPPGAGHRASQLSVHREGRESDSSGVDDVRVEVRGGTAPSQSSDSLQAPPRPPQTSTSTSLSTASSSASSTSAPLLKPSTLHLGESVVLCSSVRPTASARSSSPLSFCLPSCCFASDSSGLACSLLLTSAGRLLLVEDGRGGEVSREWQLSGTKDGSARVDSRGQVLRLAHPLRPTEASEWELASGASAADWLRAVEAIEAERRSSD